MLRDTPALTSAVIAMLAAGTPKRASERTGDIKPPKDLPKSSLSVLVGCIACQAIRITKWRRKSGLDRRPRATKSIGIESDPPNDALVDLS
jgi:hypothetical protein